MAYLRMHDNTDIYYAEEGSGSPVIMLHGWKASSDVFETVSGMLQDSFRCIRYDHRGHKRSQVPCRPPQMKDLADDLNEIIQTLCPTEKPVLIGWSMGAATVLEYVKRYGCGMIDRIILVDLSPCMLNDENWHLGRAVGTYTVEQLEEDLLIMSTDFRSFMRRYYEAGNPHFRERSQEQQEDMITERLSGFDTWVLTSLWESLCRADYRSMLSNITVPVAVFYAGILPSCQPKAAEYYAQTIPGGAYCFEFRNASHALITEYPKLFVQKVRDFVIEGTRGTGWENNNESVSIPGP